MSTSVSSDFFFARNSFRIDFSSLASLMMSIANANTKKTTT